jgi:hypothetical protein
MTLFKTGDGKAVLATCHRALCEIETLNINARALPSAVKKCGFSWRDVFEEVVAWPTNIQPPCKYLFLHSTIDKYMWLDKGYNRLVLPVYDETYSMKGIVGKRLGPGSNPKSVYLADLDYYGLSWYTTALGNYGEKVVLVEDGLSALALYENGVDAIALNGTGLNDSKITAITSQYDMIYLALDADATRIAIRLSNRYRGVATIIVRRLINDIKDMSNDEVREWVEEL